MLYMPSSVSAGHFLNAWLKGNMKNSSGKLVDQYQRRRLRSLLVQTFKHLLLGSVNSVFAFMPVSFLSNFSAGRTIFYGIK